MMQRRAPLGPGDKSVQRGSTFASRGQGLKRSTAKTKRSGFTPASPAQRAKAQAMTSIVSGKAPCDPAHLTPRSMGGCDHPLCVIPLTRDEHRAFDDGRLDVLGDMIARGMWDEMAHMISAHHIDPISMLQRLTGERWTAAKEDLLEPREA